MPSGIIIRGVGGFYYVKSEGGTYECKARGVFRKKELTPLTGDRVIFSITDDTSKKGIINKIEKRSLVLVRPAVANVNQLVAVLSVKSPDPDLLLLDKLLVTAKKNEIESIVCINKTDLDTEGSSKVLRNIYSGAGFKVIETSSKENKGFQDLGHALAGRISVFAGQSGVGKSTILNIITDTLVMKTGSVSEKIKRGRHTTRHTELVELANGGLVADTPGFSTFEIEDVYSAELQFYYPEFADFINKCRFRGCNHVNEPDCRIKEAVKDGLIDNNRYEGYVRFFILLKQNEDAKYK